MSSFAAILVLVACPINSAHCVSQPVRIVTYERAQECEKHMPAEIKRNRIKGMRIIGACNPFDSRLMANLAPVNMTASAAEIRALGSQRQTSQTAVGFAESGR